MRTRFLTVTLAGVLSLLGAAGALGQEATPEAANLFADLGLPELTVTATDTGLSVDQSEIPAGRYVVTLVDETTAAPADDDFELATGFVRLDEGETPSDFDYSEEIAAGTPAPGDEAPVETYQFFFDNYITGGPSVSSPWAVVDLPAGDYAVWPDDPFSETPVAALTVTGDPTERVTGPEPEAVATIIEEGAGGQGFSFRIDGGVQGGQQIVKILNASDQPHFVIAMQYPEPITMDQVMGAFMFDPSSGTTPSPDMLDFEQVAFAGYAALQSAGTTQWVTMDLAAGQAILVCFIPDPEAGGVPHAFEGMIQLVEVE
jgi:hypothetical protein